MLMKAIKMVFSWEASASHKSLSSPALLAVVITRSRYPHIFPAAVAVVNPAFIFLLTIHAYILTTSRIKVTPEMSLFGGISN